MKHKIAIELLKKVKKDYNEIAQEFDRTRYKSWVEFNDFKPFLKSNENIIDIGCGNGRLIEFFKKCEITNIRYLGIDNSTEFIEICKKKYPNSSFKLADMTDLKEKDETFDKAFSIASLHHLPSAELRNKALNEVKKVLKRNGYLFITVWNLRQRRYLKERLKAIIRSITSLGKYSQSDLFISWGNKNVERYYYAFTQSEFIKELKRGGFEVIDFKKGNNLTAICQKR